MMHQKRSGLGSLIPGAELSTGSAPMLVPISTISVNPYQPRRTFQPEALDELAESIRQHGILQPLTVRPRGDGYELIAGERRLLAAKKAGLASVPVIVRSCTDMEMLELALVENLQREDLNAMEAAHSYHRLVNEFGLSQSEIAERVGKSRSAVSNTLRLLTLPEDVQQGLENDVITEGHARALLTLEEPERQLELFKETVERGWSVRALEAQVSKSPRYVAKKPKEKKAGDDPHLQQVRSELQVLLGTRVAFKPGSDANSGTIEIDYYSAEDLARILEVLH